MKMKPNMKMLVFFYLLPCVLVLEYCPRNLILASGG